MSTQLHDPEMKDDQGRQWRRGGRADDVNCTLHPCDNVLTTEGWLGTKKTYVVLYNARRAEYYAKSLKDFSMHRIFRVT